VFFAFLAVFFRKKVEIQSNDVPPLKS